MMVFHSKIGDLVRYQDLPGKVSAVDNSQYYGIEVTFETEDGQKVCYFSSKGFMKDHDKTTSPVKLILIKRNYK